MGSIAFDRLLPDGAWDSHVHIVDEDAFPLHPKHPYRPRKASLEDLLSFERSLNASHVCLVAFSVYQDDNRCLLDGLRRLKGKGRGVVCFDPNRITDEELRSMHEIGVRGVRINWRTEEKSIDIEMLKKTAERIRPYGWCIQIYCSLRQVAQTASVISQLDTQVVLDHLGAPSGSSPPQLQEGHSEILELLRGGNVWTKLSGTYRFPEVPEIGGYVREILQTAPDRVVWASDWPHSAGFHASPGGNRDKPQEYRKIDTPAFIEQCWEWCGHDEELMRKVCVDNPRRLWQYTD